jgi:hypothetical protein
MAKQKRTAHGLRREDFPTVYHYRAAVRRATLPPPWPTRGHYLDAAEFSAA